MLIAIFIFQTDEKFTCKKLYLQKSLEEKGSQEFYHLELATSKVKS